MVEELVVRLAILRLPIHAANARHLSQLYYRARFYDPQVARFASQHPLGFTGGLNWHSYVENEPIDQSDPFGLQRLPRSSTKTRPCNSAEMERCKEDCKEKGVESCRVSQTLRMVRHLVDEKKSLLKWVDGPLSCSCNDCEDKDKVKVPVPVPNPSRRRLDQPTMDELRMQEESARQKEQFWWKVTLGGVAIGAVVVAPEGAVVGVGRFIWVGGRWLLVGSAPAAAVATSH
jgi:RHS repeat-associated protein